MKNVPKLRFSGFSDEWEEKKIGQTLKIRHGKDQKSVICENGKYPILATGGEIGRTDIPLYNKESVLIGRKGTIDRPVYMNSPFWTVDTLFYSEINNSNFPKFIFYKFQCINWKMYNEASGVPSLSASTIENIKYKLPPKNEQEKIANFLTKVDKLIEKQEEKVGNLEQYKKGMMQKIFSQEIRFKKDDGGEYQEWKIITLGKIYDFQYGQFNNNPDNGGEYPVYGANGIIGGYHEFNAEKSIIIGHMGAYAGKVIWEERKHFVTYNGTIGKPKDDEKLMSKFGYYMLVNKNIPKICAGSGQPFLSYNDLDKIKVKYPSDILEQIKIANFLSKIDSIVEKEKEKLEELREWKKGLLQGMFV